MTHTPQGNGAGDQDLELLRQREAHAKERYEALRAERVEAEQRAGIIDVERQRRIARARERMRKLGWKGLVTGIPIGAALGALAKEIRQHPGLAAAVGTAVGVPAAGITLGLSPLDVPFLPNTNRADPRPARTVYVPVPGPTPIAPSPGPTVTVSPSPSPSPTATDTSSTPSPTQTVTPTTPANDAPTPPPPTSETPSTEPSPTGNNGGVSAPGATPAPTPVPEPSLQPVSPGDGIETKGLCLLGAEVPLGIDVRVLC
ncbi:hypothetical protein [Actinomadura miaoliensis]|uniref:Uncharacterized protein n=1 Tax=Actinomadura miaoliensis TaxID=430685 RepID=A0ABP7V616_9ACTN